MEPKTMRQNTSASEKRIVEQLDFGPKTAKRVAWETWELTVVGPYQVEVTNASYGFEKDDHAYVVGVDERDGVPVPAECECPADVHRERDCKHKVALATVGGPVVLNAALAFENDAAPSSDGLPDSATTGADALKTDGGIAAVASQSDESADTCPNGDERCPGPDGDDLPCFDCFEVADERGDAR
ncbi:SWIM zinc finger family protein [Halorubrum persicum]|nr:SWIM zinc finger family protein [Halorubrum persicum]